MLKTNVEEFNSKARYVVLQLMNKLQYKLVNNQITVDNQQQLIEYFTGVLADTYFEGIDAWIHENVNGGSR
jgi:hypothetical protein